MRHRAAVFSGHDLPKEFRHPNLVKHSVNGGRTLGKGDVSLEKWNDPNKYHPTGVSLKGNAGFIPTFLSTSKLFRLAASKRMDRFSRAELIFMPARCDCWELGCPERLSGKATKASTTPFELRVCLVLCWTQLEQSKGRSSQAQFLGSGDSAMSTFVVSAQCAGPLADSWHWLRRRGEATMHIHAPILRKTPIEQPPC